MLATASSWRTIASWIISTAPMVRPGMASAPSTRKAAFNPGVLVVAGWSMTESADSTPRNAWAADRKKANPAVVR